MKTGQPDYPTRVTIEEGEDESESPTNAFIPRSRCCFHFPCFGSSPPTAAAAHSLPSPHSLSPSSAHAAPSFWESKKRWWAGPVRAFRRLREWSEIVAGPKWKTFIRRFNRRHNHRHAAASQGMFQYDPLSYALNFDEGHGGQNGQFDDDYGQFPDFSSRFAQPPHSTRSSMDLGKGGAPTG